MWTHLQPHLRDELTSGSIRKRARVHLFRSLNLRRLVAFTGSGSTMNLGMPSWDALVALMIEATNDQLKEIVELDGERSQLLVKILPLIAQIEQLVGAQSKVDKSCDPRIEMPDAETAAQDLSVAIMDLCEELLLCLPDDPARGRSRLFLAREYFAQHFRSRNLDLVGRRLRQVFPDHKLVPEVQKNEVLVLKRNLLTNPPKNHDPALYAYIVRAVMMGEIDPSEPLFQAIGPDEGSVVGGLGPQHPTGARDLNIVEALLDELKVTRIATLNYDVQLERQVFQLLGDSTGADKDAFEDLCKDKQTPRHHVKRLVIDNAVEKGATSITMSAGNTGDTVNFAAYPRRFRYQILHLHGRFDDPTNMVVTKRDYERVYIREDQPRQIFREAQEMLFGGNDVLVVGMGMSEDDVLRPFRRFMAHNDFERQDTRRIFLLRHGHSCKNCTWSEGACRECVRKDEKISLEHMVQYQVYTIFFGGPYYRFIKGQLSTLAGLATAESENKFRDVLVKLLGIDRTAGAVEKLLCPEDFETLDHMSRVALGEATNAATVKALLNEISGNVLSRGLVAELRSLQEDKGKWWDAWRHPPYERRALYHLYVPENGGDVQSDRPSLWIRHCPADVPVVRADPGAWEVLKQISEHVAGRFKNGNPEFRGTDPKENRNSRIVRLTAPRGAGKGSVIRLMMHARVRQYIFAGANGNKSGEYAGSFMVHQSFSMEFSSIAKALTRFFARHCAEFLLERPDASESSRSAAIGLSEIRKEISKAQSHSDAAERRIAMTFLMRELNTADRQHLVATGMDQITKKLRNGQALDSHEITALAERLYVARREEEPRLVEHPAFPSAEELNHTVERPHRLGVLQTVMTTLEKAMEGQEKRLFVCLSGIDRICDRNGDARNPMHRAMFRLLCGRTDMPGERDPDPAIDYVFMAGRPEFPIAFLSEERTADDPLATAEEKHYSRESRTRRVLKKWHELEPLSWSDRIELLCDNDADREIFEPFLKWVEAKDVRRQDNRTDEAHSTREIQRGLWNSVSLTIITLRTWQREVQQRKIPPGQFRQFIEPLDRAYARDQQSGVLNKILAHHEDLDRKQEDSDRRQEDLDRKQKAFDFELMRLLMRHLALYGLPVEIWVLFGCPLIIDHLRKKAPRQETGENDAAYRFRLRHNRLGKLSAHLKELCERALVIEIEPSQNSVKGDVSRHADEKKLHVRYALHARLREYIGYQMQLIVNDEGELNHHQISIFCDQPRDLPTPQVKHFDLIGSLMKKAIEECAQSLGTLYRFGWSGERYRAPRWDEPPVGTDDTKDERALQDAARHVFFPAEDAFPAMVDGPKLDGLAGAFGETHAISQRLRACFSLLRGTLSVGSLSRLDGMGQPDDVDPPFERYRAWLRALLNAAAGLERNREELALLLGGALFAGQGTTPDQKLGIQSLKTTIDRRPDDQEKLVESFNRVKGNMERIRDTGNKNGLMVRQHTQYDSLRHPFYRDEIAWLYNERGLASFMQGRLFDAIPLFNQAKFIMAHAKTPPFDTKAYHAAERRINFNLALAFIDRGKVAEAREMLEELERSMRHVARSTPSKVHLFARAYLALCDHLGGSFERAIEEYELCLRRFVEHRDLRAISIFNRHLGDLHLRIGNIDAARTHLRLAVNSGSQAEQRDVENHALASMAKLDIDVGDLDSAQGRIVRVLHYAQNMGLYRIQADIHLVDAELKLKRGELGLGAEAAARSVAMSSRHGLRLRKLSGLVTYGKIQFARRQLEFARDVLEEAKLEAESHGYQIQAAAASDMLARIGAELDRHRARRGNNER